MSLAVLTVLWMAALAAVEAVSSCAQLIMLMGLLRQLSTERLAVEIYDVCGLES